MFLSSAPLSPPVEEDDRYDIGLWWLARAPNGSRLLLITTWGVTDGLDYSRLYGGFPVAASIIADHQGRAIRAYPDGFGCQVYSMDTSQLLPQRPWKRVVSLGSYSLFLGVNYPIVIPVEAEQGNGNMARSNSVYTSHHAVGLSSSPCPEICRFRLSDDDGDVAVGFPTRIGLPWRQVPLWFVPSFANSPEWNLPARAFGNRVHA